AVIGADAVDSYRRSATQQALRRSLQRTYPACASCADDDTHSTRGNRSGSAGAEVGSRQRCALAAVQAFRGRRDDLFGQGVVGVGSPGAGAWDWSTNLHLPASSLPPTA